MEAASRVAKNTGILYAKMGITVFISLYTTRLILNALGTSDFGIFNLVGGAIAMLGFLNAAMASASQRFMSYSEGEGDKEKQKRIFNISFILHFAIAILMGIVLLFVGWFFYNGILNIAPDRMYAAKVIYGSLIVSTIFTVMTVPYDAVLNAHENMLYYSIVGVVESLLKLLVALAVLSSSGDKLILYGILMACIPLLTITAMRIYCHKKYEECIISPRKYWDKHLMKEMRGFAGWNLMSSFASMIGNYGQGIILNVFFGTRLNAAQGIANQINGQVSTFSNTLMKALNPVIAKSEGAGDRELMMRATMMGSKISFFLLMFFYVPILLEMSYLLNLWLVDIPEFAIVFTVLLLIRSLIEQLFITVATSINAVGNIKHYQIIESIIHAFPLVISYILYVNDFPAVSMYYVYILYSILKGINRLYFAKKKYNLAIGYFLNTVVFRCGITFIILFFLSSIPRYYLNEGIIRLLTIVATNALFFLIVIYFFGFMKEERKQIQPLIKNIFNKIIKTSN